MRDIKTYLNEGFFENMGATIYHPKTKSELLKYIGQHIDNGILDLNDIDTSKITDMGGLFESWNPGNIDISKWNVSKVRNMNGMFVDCDDFNCDISGWDVRNVKDMSYMFYDCSNFNQDLSKWNPASILKLKKPAERMELMFEGTALEQTPPDWYIEMDDDDYYVNIL